MKQILALVLGGALLLGCSAVAQAPQMPVFEVDRAWPGALPNNWVMTNVTKLSVDSRDNVYVLHRPRQTAAGRTPAPAVVVFDASGKFVRAWGGPGEGYDWPDAEHNIFVDHNDNVYISGSSPSGGSTTPRSDDMILKFTADGKFLKQFGGRNVVTGSKDPKAANKPGDLWVHPKTNELWVADGYGNRRVMVLDAETFALKRQWAAFGRPPTDDPLSGGWGPSGGPGQGQNKAAPDVPTVAEFQKTGDGPDRFVGPVHSVVVSHDNIVYVADRGGKRVQMYTPEGKYLDQFYVNRDMPEAGSATGLALSADPEQRFIYISDFPNSRMIVVERKSKRELYQFGVRNAEPGNFQGIHHIAVDSKGNLYTSEVAPGSRAQKFVFKGLSATPPANAVK